MMGAAVLSASAQQGAESQPADQARTIASERLRHAEDVVVPAWQGEEVRLGAEDGRVLVLSFWGLWCEPCRQEMPLLQELHETYAEDGLVVGAVHTDGVEFAERVADRFSEEGFSYRSLYDSDGSIMRIFAEQPATPLTVVIGPGGSLLYRHAGFDAGSGAALRQVVSEAVAALR